MEVGEKYLSIKILGNVQVSAFLNKEATEENRQPNFKGDGVAVWVQKKKPSVKAEEII